MGLERFEDRQDKGYSLTDCMSMIVMENYGIQEVLTSDKHFKQAGFTILM
jgi:predicted nucleic acid-binding protein